MRIFKTTLMMGLLGVMLLSQVAEGMGAQQERGERGRRGCRRSDRIKIQDLDVSPDPLVEGQRIRAWKVRIRLEGNRECDTEIEVREGREPVGRERRYTLRPGINEFEIQPVGAYRFRGREHCFTVIADLEGTRRQVDADRRFCAYQKPAWSMSERGDARGYNR
jgi:hypothetical protein